MLSYQETPEGWIRGPERGPLAGLLAEMVAPAGNNSMEIIERKSLICGATSMKL